MRAWAEGFASQARAGLAVALMGAFAGACAGAPRVNPAAPKSAPAAAARPRLVALDAAACRAVLQDDTSSTSLGAAAERSRAALERRPAGEVTVVDRKVSTQALHRVLDAVSRVAGTSSPVSLCDSLRLYRVEQPDGLLVTGYYVPELPASRRRTARFRHPLYRTPGDMFDIDLRQWCSECGERIVQGRIQDGRIVPYHTRAEIEAGVLAGREYELAWLDDPVESFFLHVQGSGRLRFDDGVIMEVSYASANGHRYASIGKLLIDQGRMAPEQVSLQSLKQYLRAHPEEGAALMSANARYIFFRPVVAGAIGSAGVPLTAGRSVAADPAVYPAGSVAFLRIAARGGSAPGVPAAQSYQRLVFVQDAGAAITGSRRLDVFWGTGAAAEEIAGEMRNPGEIYLLLPE